MVILHPCSPTLHPPTVQTVCYIIPVNAAILSDTGGTCDPAVE